MNKPKIDISRLVYLWEQKDFNNMQKHIRKIVAAAYEAGRNDYYAEKAHTLAMEALLDNV